MNKTSHNVNKVHNGCDLGAPSCPSCEIFRIIAQHRGSEHAIRSVDICALLGWRPTMEREVRRVIAEQYTEWPEIVCAKIGGRGEESGYFIAQTYEEIEAYWANLYDNAARRMEKTERFEIFVESKGINLKQKKAA